MERSREELDTRLKQQIQFIVEVDKVKNIFRQTYLADANRKENERRTFLASGAYGSTFKGLHERRDRSGEGDDHGSDP